MPKPFWAKAQSGRPRRGVLYWVDISGCTVHIFYPAAGTDLVIDVGQPVGTIVPRRSGGRDGGAARRLRQLLPLDTGAVKMIADPEAHLPGNRFNDGKCDSAGRFWAGTMRRAEDQRGGGSLYRLEPDLSVHKMWGVSPPNGLAWSHDARTMYYIDTPTLMVEAFDYDIETGAIANPKPDVHTPDGPGYPDGMTSMPRGCSGWRIGAAGGSCAGIRPPARRWPSSSCRWSESPPGSAVRTWMSCISLRRASV